MKYRTSSYAYNTWDTYWFEKNLQGDIIGVYSDTGTKLITYNYDPWGEFNTTYYNGGANTTAVNNNLRYRGYYYDSDLQLYYLISRYYDSNTGRFISPDIPETITLTRMSLADKNLYAYCDNNPIMRSDDGGDFWHIIAGAAIGFVAGIVTSVVEQLTNPEDEFSVGEMLLSATIGGGMGALTATGVPMYALVAASAGSAFVESTITGFVDKYDEDPSNKDATVGDIFLDATIDAGISAVFTAASYTGDGKNMKSLYVASKNASARFTGTVHPRVKSQIAGTVKTYYKQLGRDIVSDIKDTTIFGAGQFVIDYLADKLF